MNGGGWISRRTTNSEDTDPLNRIRNLRRLSWFKTWVEILFISVGPLRKWTSWELEYKKKRDE